MLLRRGATAPELLTAEGMAVGLDEGPLFDTVLEEKEIGLKEGDLVALYTDGITEARNPRGEEFTRDRLAGTLLRHEDRSLGEMARTVERFVRRFSALTPRHDDSTLLLFRLR